jgi:hypothetical protein
MVLAQNDQKHQNVFSLFRISQKFPFNIGYITPKSVMRFNVCVNTDLMGLAMCLHVKAGAKAWSH